MYDYPRAMVGAGASLVAGKWTFHNKPMTCGKCGGDQVYITKDREDLRVNDCADCGAVGAVTKGAMTWWYHDWSHPVDMAPAWRDRLFA